MVLRAKILSGQDRVLSYFARSASHSRTHFVTAVHADRRPSSEKSRFTGLSANSKTQAFPNSAKGKAAKITVQKQPAESKRERVLPEDRQQSTSYAPTSADPTRPGASRRGPQHTGGGGSSRTPARRCASRAPHTPGQGEHRLPAPDTERGQRGATGPRGRGPLHRSRARGRSRPRRDGGRVREQRQHPPPPPARPPQPALTCRWWTWSAWARARRKGRDRSRRVPPGPEPAPPSSGRGGPGEEPAAERRKQGRPAGVRGNGEPASGLRLLVLRRPGVPRALAEPAAQPSPARHRRRLSVRRRPRPPLRGRSPWAGGAGSHGAGGGAGRGGRLGRSLLCDRFPAAWPSRRPPLVGGSEAAAGPLAAATGGMRPGPAAAEEGCGPGPGGRGRSLPADFACGRRRARGRELLPSWCSTDGRVGLHRLCDAGSYCLWVRCWALRDGAALCRIGVHLEGSLSAVVCPPPGRARRPEDRGDASSHAALPSPPLSRACGE